MKDTFISTRINNLAEQAGTYFNTADPVYTLDTEEHLLQHPYLLADAVFDVLVDTGHSPRDWNTFYNLTARVGKLAASQVPGYKQIERQRWNIARPIAVDQQG